MVKIVSLIAFSLYFFSSAAHSQEIHFSQHGNASSLINPAFNSLFIGDWRGGAIYRNQWRTADKPYETYTAYFDKRWEWIYDIFTLSLTLNNDLSGNRNLHRASGLLTISYSRKFGNSALTIGFSPSYNQFYVNKDISFPDQFDPAEFAFSSQLPGDEPLINYNEGYFALNTGGLWSLSTPKLGAYTGLGIFNINTPRVSFYNGDNRSFLPMKAVFHGGVAMQITEAIAIHPSFILSSQNRSSIFVLGSWIELVLKDSKNLKGIRTGLYYRNNLGGYSETGFFKHSDALIIPISIGFNDFRATMSYDINISGFELATSNRGGFELSLIYISPQKKSRNFLQPCWMF